MHVEIYHWLIAGVFALQLCAGTANGIELPKDELIKQTRDYERTKAQMEAAGETEAWSDYQFLLNSLLRNYRLLGDKENEERTLKLCIRVDSDNHLYLEDYAAFLEQNHRLEEARKIIGTSVKLELRGIGWVPVKNPSSSVLSTSEILDDLLRPAVYQAVRGNPISMLKDLTGFLVRVGKYDEAESILRKELELVQGEIDSPLPARKEKVITGNHCGEVGPTEEGVRDWRSQQLQTVSEDLANCLLRERNWAEAETHFRRSLEIQTKRAAKSEIGNPCQGDIWWLVLTSQFGLAEALMMQAKLDEALPIYEKIYEYKRSRFVSPEVADDDYSKLNVLPVVSKLNKLATDFRARATMLQSEGQLKRAIDSMKSATSILRLVPGEQQVNVDNFWQNCALPNFKGRSTAINVGGGWYRASPRPSEIRHAAYKQKLIMSTQGPNPSLQSAVEALQSLETSSSNI